jgi:hypothetical protein
VAVPVAAQTAAGLAAEVAARALRSPRRPISPSPPTPPGVAQVAITPGPITPEPVKPSSAFSFGKLKLNRLRGTARLSVKLPGPGTLALAGEGLAAKRQRVAAGQLMLLIKAKGKFSRLLSRVGKVKLRARVTFTPTGGDPNTQVRTIGLIKRAR